MAPNSYCTIVTVFFVNIIRIKFNTQIHICSLLGCLSCSVARVPQLAQVPRLAGLALVAWLLRCLAGAWGLCVTIRTDFIRTLSFFFPHLLHPVSYFPHLWLIIPSLTPPCFILLTLVTHHSHTYSTLLHISHTCDSLFPHRPYYDTSTPIVLLLYI